MYICIYLASHYIMSNEDELDRELIGVLKQLKEAKKNSKGATIREKEVRYMLWIDKELMSKLKLKALKNEATVKDLVEISLRRLLNEY